MLKVLVFRLHRGSDAYPRQQTRGGASMIAKSPALAQIFGMNRANIRRCARLQKDRCTPSGVSKER